jgi:hypothetical protein
MAQTKYKIRPRKRAHLHIKGLLACLKSPAHFHLEGKPKRPILYQAACTSPKRNMNYHTKSRQAQYTRIREQSCVTLHLHPFSLVIICDIIIIIIIMRNTTFLLVCFFPLTSLSLPSLSLSYYYFSKFHL